MDKKNYTEEVTVKESHLKTGMSFLSENPEAYGIVHDACPVATSNLLIAVNGHDVTGGAISPTYPVETNGVDGLLDTLYGNLIPRTDDNARLLHATFGESEGIQEHPVARYCAALAESVALGILTGPAAVASFEQTSIMLSTEISAKLGQLRETVCSDSMIPDEPVYFTVSLGACRITRKGEGSFTLDVFSAGNFRVFLLDGEGLHPLWSTDTAVLSPELAVAISGKSMTLHHPEPFAILLLSDSICTLSPAEIRALRENPGLIWRYRMRLEDHLLRVITACIREQEFGERAARFFMGRSHGRDSATGAMMILREGASYEVFRSACQTRLSQLEDMIALMPDGYDPTRVSPLPPREEAEMLYLRRLLEQESSLSDRVTEALRLCALDKLKKGKTSDPVAPPSNVPDYYRLSYEEVYATYNRYDCENAADRDRVEQNRRILRENLTDHWITLRPYLKRTSDRVSSPAAERSFAACAEMNAHLGRMRSLRKKALNGIETLLSDSLTVLHTEGKDWIDGRAGDRSITAWADKLESGIPIALASILHSWQSDTDRYRSLHTAYSYERELLFRMDIAEDGFFAAEWQGIFDGTLSEDRWSRMLSAPGIPVPYCELLESLRRVSKGTGALLSRIESRGAERRMARDLANRVDLHLHALRASAYEDTDWGESVLAIMDPPMRRSFRDAVRRWEESCELNARRERTYTEYVTAYTAYTCIK